MRTKSNRKRSFVRAFGASASRSWGKLKRSRSNTFKSATSGRSSASHAVTVQNDNVVDFRSRKRRGGKRAKRAKVFRRKVSSVIQSQYPNNRVLHQSVLRLTTLQDATGATSFQLFGGDGQRNTNNNPCADLRHMFIESLSGRGFGTGTGTAADRGLEFDQQMSQTAAGVSTELGDPRIFFSKGVMETTFRNVHATNEVIVEVYQFITRRTAPSATNVAGDSPGFNSPADAYAFGFTKMHTLQSEGVGAAANHILGGPVQAFTSVGTTPFQSQLFTKFFKIVKRTRYRLAAGTEASFVHHFPKRFSLKASQVRARSALAGITNGFIFQIQGCPGIGADTFPHMALASDVVFTNIRHYNMKYFPGLTGTASLTATNDIYQLA